MRVPGNHHSALLKLHGHVDYSFRISAVNEVGKGQPSRASGRYKTPASGLHYLPFSSFFYEYLILLEPQGPIHSSDIFKRIAFKCMELSNIQTVEIIDFAYLLNLCATLHVFHKPSFSFCSLSPCCPFLPVCLSSAFQMLLLTKMIFLLFLKHLTGTLKTSRQELICHMKWISSGRQEAMLKFFSE